MNHHPWTLDNDYIALVDDALDNGSFREGRNGGTTSVFGRMLTHDMRSGFPAITTRRLYPDGVFGELAAFLEGSTSLQRFKELGCHYWDMNAGGQDDLGRIYGAQWRDFHGWSQIHDEIKLERVDQLRVLVDGLRTNPNGRRHILTTWNPAELADACLPPCHLLNQYWCSSGGNNGLLHSVVYMRSVDLCLGLPSDLLLYGLLLQLVAMEVGREPGRLTFMLGDAHVYENHEPSWSHQRVRAHTVTDSRPLLHTRGDCLLFKFNPESVELLDYHPHGAIRYALN